MRYSVGKRKLVPRSSPAELSPEQLAYKAKLEQRKLVIEELRKTRKKLHRRRGCGC